MFTPPAIVEGDPPVSVTEDSNLQAYCECISSRVKALALQRGEKTGEPGMTAACEYVDDWLDCRYTNVWGADYYSVSVSPEAVRKFLSSSYPYEDWMEAWTYCDEEKRLECCIQPLIEGVLGMYFE